MHCLYEDSKLRREEEEEEQEAKGTAGLSTSLLSSVKRCVARSHVTDMLNRHTTRINTISIVAEPENL